MAARGRGGLFNLTIEMIKMGIIKFSNVSDKEKQNFIVFLKIF